MKRKININRPEISSDEIAKRKDFNTVFKHHTGANKPFFKKPLFLSSIAVTVAAIIVSVAVLNKKLQPTSYESSVTIENSATLDEFYKKEQAKPCIAPPLKDVNVKYTTYTVNAEKGATLDFKTGSLLTIPKNVFADEKGNPVKGDVELRYREFHDPVDFFVSGIPMTYDSGGTKYQFESSGMMEMLASQDGKPVTIAKGKSIDVKLASDQKGDEYNLYKLDTLHNNWSCLGKDKVVAKTNNGANAAPVSVSEVRDLDTMRSSKQEILKEKEKKIAALPKVAEPRKPVEARKDKHTFDIAVDANEFPELAVYKGVWFEVGDENKNFSTSSYDIVWDDASLKEGTKKGENYLLTLSKGSKVLKLIVYPVFEGKNYVSAQKDYEKKFEKYTATIEKRKAEEKRIEEEYQARLLAYKKEQEELERKAKQKDADQFKLMNTQEKVYRVFTVSNFGVYNSDCPHNYPQGVLCTANLINDKNVPLMCYDVYLVDKARNGLFTYYKNPVTQFSFNPESTNMLWTVEDGVLYYLKPEQFKDMKGSNGMSNLKMNRVEQKFATVEEMKSFFNI